MSSARHCLSQRKNAPPFRSPINIRVGFWQNGFLRIFIFGPPDFFADFAAGLFLLIFVPNVARKILQENPRQNPLKFIRHKSPTHFCRGARPIFFKSARTIWCIDILPEALASARSLQRLDSMFNRFGGAIADAAASLASLARLAGTENHLTGSVPDAVRSLSRIAGSQGEIIYTPPLPPHFWLKGIFERRGVGVLFFEAPRGRNFKPPTPRF